MNEAYYNENDPFAAQWLKNLIDAGLIARGIVDTRSIVDVGSDDLAGFGQHHFFAGIGGWSYALQQAGWPDDRPVWTGSCPCQPFSNAGKRLGTADERHLWPAWSRLIAKRHPAIVLGEQVAASAEWFRLVRSDLEAMGYAVGCIPIEAASAGADHLRNRLWFLGDLARERWRERQSAPAVREGRRPWPDIAGNGVLVDTHGNFALVDSIESGLERQPGDGHGGAGRPNQAGPITATGDEFDYYRGADGKTRRVKSGIRLLVDGFPSRVGLLRGFGNAIDPRPARAFIETVMDLCP